MINIKLLTNPKLMQKRIPSPSISKFIVILAGIVSVLLIIVNNSVTVDRLVSDLSILDSKYKELEFSNDSLQAELKKLSSAERITKIASQSLGLVYTAAKNAGPGCNQ